MSEEKQEVVGDQEVVVETPEEEPVKEAAPAAVRKHNNEVV